MGLKEFLSQHKGAVIGSVWGVMSLVLSMIFGIQGEGLYHYELDILKPLIVVTNFPTRIASVVMKFVIPPTQSNCFGSACMAYIWLGFLGLIMHLSLSIIVGSLIGHALIDRKFIQNVVNKLR